MKLLKSFLEIWKKFMYILTPAQKVLGIVTLCSSSLGAFLEMLGVSIILPLVQVMIDIDSLREKSYIRSLNSIFNIDTDKALLSVIVIFIIIVYLVKNIYLCFETWLRNKYSNKINRELSIRILSSYLKRGYNFFRINNSAVLLRGCRDNIQGITEVVFCFFQIIAELLKILFILGFLIVTDLFMSIALLIIALICLIIVVACSKGIVKRAGIVAYEKTAENNKWVLQLFNGIKEIFVMHRERFFLDNYEKTYIAQQKANLINNLFQQCPAYFIEGLCITGIMAAVGVKIYNVANPANYIATLATFAVAAFRILPSVGKIAANFNVLVFRFPSVDESYNSIKEANEVLTNTLEDNKKTGIQEFRDKLLIDDLYFKYIDGDDYVLEGTSIDIKEGESVAFVGPSGAGKSTLVDVILGLLLPNKGHILFDGMDIADFGYDISKIIGFVPQSTYLMDDTVRKNVAFGIDEKEIIDEEVWRALEQSQMKEVIEDLPEGLNTMVGDRGIRFSGGQAQRLSIARALYNNPKILVLDEATSALDNNTEKEVMDSIDKLQGKITMIIIAHRLSTVKNCNHIYEIKDGKAIERKYEDLI